MKKFFAYLSFIFAGVFLGLTAWITDNLLKFGLHHPGEMATPDFTYTKFAFVGLLEGIIIAAAFFILGIMIDQGCFSSNPDKDK